MRRVLVLYATVEGQSRKVAEHAAARLHDKGFDVRVLDVRDVRYPFALQDYRAALLVAPVHASFHPREMVRFVTGHREELEKMPVRFLSLSLSQAGVELATASPEQRARAAEDVRHLVGVFCAHTGFAASKVTPIAGSLAYSQYGLLKRLILKHIAKKAGGSTDTSRDHAYTNFERVDSAVDELCAGLVEEASASAVPGHPHALVHG